MPAARLPVLMVGGWVFVNVLVWLGQTRAGTFVYGGGARYGMLLRILSSAAWRVATRAHKTARRLARTPRAWRA